MVVFNKEELYNILVNTYDVEEKTAIIIIDNFENRHHFSESEEILLLSHGIPMDFLNEIQIKNSSYFVGPFFYIGGKIVASKERASSFDLNLRFFDSNISHFDFFTTLLVDGDYGNYPRGRVIYDNLNKEFIIYMDKCLFRNSIKEEIITTYELKNEKVMFKRDIHYTHDGL